MKIKLMLLTALLLGGMAQAHDGVSRGTACHQAVGAAAPYTSTPYSRVSVVGSQPGAILQTTTAPVMTSTYNVNMPLPGAVTTMPATSNGYGYIPGVISTPASIHGAGSIPGALISPVNSSSMILVPPGTY